MVQNLAIVLVLLWIPQALRQGLLWLYWLQVKEYRLDRFGVLFSTGEGRKRLEVRFILLKFVILLPALYFELLVFVAALVFLLLDGLLLWNIVKRTLRKPQLTLRAKEIFATSLSIAVLILAASFYTALVPALLAGEALIFLSSFIGVLWTAPFVWINKREDISKAKETLERVKPKVIGIAGSYGKTTTKEFLAQLLSQKYKTAKTTGSENTEFGIARKTRKFVKSGTEYFVVEMGAYKRGEIKKLAKIVNPQVALVTGIELQHLSLFGSLENIKRAKYELVESLPKGGAAVFNYSNPHCREMAGWAKEAGFKVYGYSVLREAEVKSDMQGRVVSADVEGITFEVKEGDTRKKFFAPLRGTHFIENLLGAILISRLMDVSWEDIGRGCRAIKLPEKTMDVSQKRDMVLIDDTFNSTPKGFEAALSYLKLFEGKKVLVASGIIELGKETARIHRELGKRMKGIDLVILTNDDFAQFVREGFGGGDKLVVVSNPEQFKKQLAKVAGQKAVLLEGRIPESFRKVLD